MKPSGIITFLSDFGLSDSYVAAVKGVLLTICPGATLVDITHQVPPQDVIGGASVLVEAIKTFPRGTVHLGVVDPGVGSYRHPLAIENDTAWFVGPDNGLFFCAVQGRPWKAVALKNVESAPAIMSSTFHGRDLFAPAAAELCRGTKIKDLGPFVQEIKALEIPRPTKSKGEVRGTVIRVDHFGNLITNISASDLAPEPRDASVSVGQLEIGKIATCYADAAPSKLCALIGSNGCLEIALRDGSAQEETGLGRGASVLCEM